MNERTREKFSLKSSLARYFLQGLIVSGLFAVFMTPWVFAAFYLVFVNPFIVIGSILSFLLLVLLLLIAAGMNAVLTESVWHVYIELGWGYLLAQAVLLFVALLVADIPAYFMLRAFLSWPTVLLVSVAYFFIDGFVAKQVAFTFKTSMAKGESFREVLTVLKYPGIIAMFMADAIVVCPSFVVSLSTSYWWLGIALFTLVQSPLIYLAVIGIQRERNWVTQPRDGWWLPDQGQKQGKAADNERLTRKYSSMSVSARFFLHGIALSALLLTFGLVGQVLVVFIELTVIDFTGVIVGFIVALVLVGLMTWFVTGGLNVLLTEYIWHVSIKKDWKRLLAHGFALTVALGLAEALPLETINLTISGLTTPAVFLMLYSFLIILYCFIDGMLARRVAYIWERPEASLRYEDL